MKNDTRETIPVNGNFYEQVKDLFDRKLEIAILYENNGVTRANGLITGLYEKEGFRRMQLNGEIEIRIDKLYAVNGTFSDDYSEC